MTLFIPPDLIMSDFLQTRPAPHSPAQHSTAYHSPAQPSTAQPSPAPHIVSVSAIFKPIFSSMTLATLSFIYSSATRLCKESI